MAVKKKKPSAKIVPESVEVRMYNVGLGDSILLTFHSKSGTKKLAHRVLIDCGSTGRNSTDGPNLEQVAKEIVKDCGGKNAVLDALVVTHRHQDHMSGFGGAAGKILTENLRPKLIIQPWTEEPGAANPKAKANATEKAAASYAFSLHDAQEVTDSILKEILVRRESGMDRETDEAAIFYCQKNLPFSEGLTFKKAKETDDDDELLTGLNVETLKNIDAITNLTNWKWSSGTPERKWVQKDDLLKLGIPGLTVKVLGPIGPKRWKELDGKGSNLAEELWKKLQALRGVDQPETTQPEPTQAKSENTDAEQVRFKEEYGTYGVPPIFPNAEQVDDSEFKKDSVRWLREKLDLLRGDQLLQFVTVLDKHINNTSVVLLLEFGGFRMLFPGDAEVAAWQGIMSDAKAEASIEKIDLYKVGHHGSNNATPIKSLWEKLIADRDKDNPLHCVLSTQTTKFQGSIPNKTLLETMLESDALHLVSTAYLDGETSAHAEEWSVVERGTGSKRVVMSYSRKFDV